MVLSEPKMAYFTKTQIPSIKPESNQLAGLFCGTKQLEITILATPKFVGLIIAMTKNF